MRTIGVAWAAFASASSCSRMAFTNASNAWRLTGVRSTGRFCVVVVVARRVTVCNLRVVATLLARARTTTVALLTT